MAANARSGDAAGFRYGNPGAWGGDDEDEMRNFRARTELLRSRVREMILQKKSRDEISPMRRKSSIGSPFLLDYGLDGLPGELR